MTRHDIGRLVAALGLAAAAGWVGACIVIGERLTRPHRPPPLNLLDAAVTDGTIAGR